MRLPTHAVIERMSGNRPSAPRAMGAAIAVGTTAATLTYKLLRRQEQS
jgi:hypothetical protein